MLLINLMKHCQKLFHLPRKQILLKDYNIKIHNNKILQVSYSNSKADQILRLKSIDNQMHNKILSFSIYYLNTIHNSNKQKTKIKHQLSLIQIPVTMSMMSFIINNSLESKLIFRWKIIELRNLKISVYLEISCYKKCNILNDIYAMNHMKLRYLSVVIFLFLNGSYNMLKLITKENNQVLQ